MGNFTHTINPQPIKLGNSILNSEFDNNILNTLVSDLVPNLNKLDLLSYKVYY